MDTSDLAFNLYGVIAVLVQWMFNKKAPLSQVLLGVAGGFGMATLAREMARGTPHPILGLLLPVAFAACVALIVASFAVPEACLQKVDFAIAKKVDSAVDAAVNAADAVGAGPYSVNAFKGPSETGPSVTVDNVPPTPMLPGKPKVKPTMKIEGPPMSTLERLTALVADGGKRLVSKIQ